MTLSSMASAGDGVQKAEEAFQPIRTWSRQRDSSRMANTFQDWSHSLYDGGPRDDGKDRPEFLLPCEYQENPSMIFSIVCDVTVPPCSESAQNVDALEFIDALCYPTIVAETTFRTESEYAATLVRSWCYQLATNSDYETKTKMSR